MDLLSGKARDCVARIPRSGMTLVEVMIVAAIIALLTAVAIPSIAKARTHTQNIKFINALRVVNDSILQHYAIENGDYPPDAPEKTVPAGLEDYSPKGFDWDEPTDIGGTWDWDRTTNRQVKVRDVCYACLWVRFPKRTTGQMADIDSLIDDGDLSTGRFRRFTDGYMYIIEE